jgi:hypothetical protein
MGDKKFRFEFGPAELSKIFPEFANYEEIVSYPVIHILGRALINLLFKEETRLQLGATDFEGADYRDRDVHDQYKVVLRRKIVDLVLVNTDIDERDEDENIWCISRFVIKSNDEKAAKSFLSKIKRKFSAHSYELDKIKEEAAKFLKKEKLDHLNYNLRRFYLKVS